MATIDVGEDDFMAIGSAAFRALRSGDRELALRLDKIAQKINAALSSAEVHKAFGRMSKSLSWEEVQSTLGEDL